MKGKHKHNYCLLYCAIILISNLTFPISIYAHTGGSLGGLGYILFGFLFFFCAFISSLFKRILYMPAKERGNLGYLSLLIMIAESALMPIIAIIVYLLASIFDFLPGNVIIFIFSVLYLITAIFFNLTLFQNENQTYIDTIKNVSNWFNAAIIAMFTPGMFIGFLIYFSN